MYRRRGNRWLYDSPKRRRRSGREAALRHIEEAQQLSQTLGGTDSIVKNFLFNLPQGELDRVLTQYGSVFGDDPESYARKTMPRWRSGKVQMSGMVASRLYQFLPPRMPLNLKYDIAERLWRHVGPSSQKSLRFGPGVSSFEVIRQASDYISQVVTNYKIPPNLEEQFDWLTSKDITAKQLLLNHLRDLDKDLVVEAVNLQVPIMTEHLSSEASKNTQLFTHTVTVGKHNLQLQADHKATGCQLEETRRIGRTDRSQGDKNWVEKNSGWIWVAAIAAGIILLILINN